MTDLDEGSDVALQGDDSDDPVRVGEFMYASLRAQVRDRMAVARHPPTALIGIHTGGALIAQRLHVDLGLSMPLGFLSIAFHRDDYGQRGLPEVIRRTQIDFSIDDQRCLLVDDILFTGRTVRAAINELFDYGRPRAIELAILLDRGGRELPIRADHLGGRHAVAPGDRFALSQLDDGRFSLVLERA